MKILNHTKDYYKRQKQKLILEKNNLKNEQEEWKINNKNCKNSSQKSYLDEMKKSLVCQAQDLNKEIQYLKEFEKWIKQREERINYYECKLHELEGNNNNMLINDTFNELDTISNELNTDYNRLFYNNNNNMKDNNNDDDESMYNYERLSPIKRNPKSQSKHHSYNNNKPNINNNNNVLPLEWLESMKNEILVELKRYLYFVIINRLKK